TMRKQPNPYLEAGGVSGAGTGTGTGAADGAGISLAGEVVRAFSSFSRLSPSPYRVTVIMMRIGVIIRMGNRVGSFMKNKTHLGLIMPIMKNRIVKMPRLIA
ncbi:MAG: hypothetical protein ACXWTH_13330, partial [Methylosarcina sp.]